MNQQNPTADYRKYPKGPNFNLIVALAAIFIVVAAVAVVLFLHKDAGKVDPHGPNPRPNAVLSRPSPSPAPGVCVA